MAKVRRKDPLIWGIILIVIGMIFVLENANVDAWDYLARFWPVILIIWGAAKLFHGLKERKEENPPKTGQGQP